MTIKERLMEDMKTAMKAKEELRLLVIRTLRSEIKKVEIDGKKELDDAGVIDCITRAIKQRQDAVMQFEKGGRTDLVNNERAQIVVLQCYLPQQLSEVEIKNIIQDAKKESGAMNPSDIGKLMKILMPKVKGRADGSLVQRLVKEILV